MLHKKRWIFFKLAEWVDEFIFKLVLCNFVFKAINFKMYEIQRIISASAKIGIYREKYPSHQQLLQDLSLTYAQG